MPAERAAAPPALRAPLGAVALAAAMALLPLALTPVLPLVDAYAHAVRYLVLSGRPLPPGIEASYAPAWALLPNLGVDVLGAALMRLLEPLAAMKLIGALMILAPMAGILALSAALHGRATAPAALVAGVVGIGHITIWGFTNFLVGLGAMLGAAALWVALAPRPRAQLAAGLALGVPLLMTHGLAFMFWGLVLGGIELARAWAARGAGGLRPAALAWRAARLLSLAVAPVLVWRLMPTGGAEAGLISGTVRNLAAHAEAGALWARLGAEAADRASVFLRVGETGWARLDPVLGAALWALLAWALWTRRLALHPLMGPPALVMLAMAVLTPPSLFGVGYVADRLPLMLACLLGAGLHVPDGPGRAAAARPVLAGLVALVALDGALTTAAWARQGRAYAGYLEAVRTLPPPPAGAALTAAPVFLDRAGARGGGAVLACKPLAPLLTLTGAAAVPTFANATQQPLRLDGPLAAARDARQRGAGVDAVTAVLDAGYDLAIACRGTDGPLPEAGRILAEGPRWRLVGAAADRP